MKRIIMKNKTIELCIIRGVEGDCVVLNDYRIAGSKPWGGGEVVKSWQIDIGLIKEALNLKKINA